MRGGFRRLVLTIAVLALPTSASAAADPTLEQRVDAREAIERVYAAHREGSRRTFEEAAPRSLLQSQVRNHLRLSVALERFWNTPLTASMLDRELDRMVRNTSMPDRLEQLFAALDHDPILIREELVRPVLVKRLTRNFFDKDERIHADESISWEVWWERNAPAFDENDAWTVAVSSRLPALPAAGPEGACHPVGTWNNGSLDDGLVFRHRHTAVWTGTEMLVFGGGPNGYPEGARYDPATDTWTNLSRVGTPVGRDLHNAAWTGSRMIVWGGETNDGTYLGDGGLYDPVTDSWTPMSAVGAPSARSGATSVWTGTHFIVWGGSDGSFLNTGGIYDPVADSWSSITTTNAPTGRIYHTAVWTGSRMIVWGGRDTSIAAVNTGARYDPIADSWAPTRTNGAPLPLEDHTAVWSGTRMIVWSRAQVGGGIYNAASNGWTPVNDVGAPSPAENHTAIWTGNEMLVFGGYDSGGGGHLSDGATFNQITGVWTPISDVNAPPISDASTIWTGTTMIIWQGNVGGRYDVTSDSWTPVNGGVWIPGYGGEAVWTGNRLIFADWFGTGIVYDPVLDAWNYTANSGASNQFGHTAVWSGDEMLVWGGYSNYVTPGTRYDPVADSWSVMSTTGGPPGHVIEAMAVWIGSGMFVWGGLEIGGIELDVGGIYDPLTDTWKSVSSVDAPAGRYNSAAVWTGSEVIFWGGSPQSGNPNKDDGARYDPVSDSWTPTTQVGAPTGRRSHSAIWTGTHMIIWGGVYLDSGALYDPVADTWTPTSLVDAPEARYWHSATWTGREMVVWAGRTESESQVGTGTGGRYDPATDTWQATTMIDAPRPRREHDSVWTGNEVIVWGGGQGSAGRYTLGDSFDDDGDGTSECAGDCNDGNAGVHAGAAETCDGLDNDCNGAVDDLDLDSDGVSLCGRGDCNDADGGAFASPAEVATLSFTDDTTLSWDSTAPTAGSGTVHDIVIGLLSEGAPGTGVSETCTTAAAGTDSTTHSALPPSGDAFWYLVRGRNSCGDGPYGVQSDGSPRTTPTCP